MSAIDPEPEGSPESVRTLVVGSPRRCPVCQAVDLTRAARRFARLAAAGHGRAGGRRRRGKRGTGRSGHS